MFVYTCVQGAYTMKKALDCQELELKVDFKPVKMGAWTRLQSSKRTTSTLPWRVISPTPTTMLFKLLNTQVKENTHLSQKLVMKKDFS